MKFYNSKDYVQHLASKMPFLMAYDENNHEEWREKAKEKLTELLGLPLIPAADDMFTITETIEKDTYTQYKFEYQSEEDYFVPCDLLVPKGAKGPLPLTICLQGHSSGKHISVGEPIYPGDEPTIAGGRDFAIQAVNEGFVAIAMEQRYMGASGIGDEKGNPQCLKPHTVPPTFHLGRTPIGERVWDISRLIDVVEKHLTQYINPEKIICMGNSGGGTATFYAGCLEERIKVCVPSCAVCTYGASILAMAHCDCNYIPGVRRYFDMGDLGCLVAPRGYVQVNGAEDKIFPIGGAKESFENIKKAYKKLGVEDKCHMVIGDGGHRFYPVQAWPIVKELIK